MREAPHLTSNIICWPLKVDLICGFPNLFPSDTCDPSNVIDAHFQDEYAALKVMEKHFTTKEKVSFNYTISEFKAHNAEKMIYDSTQSIKAEIDKKAKLIRALKIVVDKLMLFLFLKVVWGKARRSFCELVEAILIKNSIHRCNQVPQ